MKKLFALVLAGMMILSLAACGAKEEPAKAPAAPESDVAYVKDNGTLKVITYCVIIFALYL